MNSLDLTGVNSRFAAKPKRFDLVGFIHQSSFIFDIHIGHINQANVGLIDVPYVDIKNEAALVDETNQVKALGFSGKAAIHPCQIKAIHQAFMPSAEQVAYAQQVMAAVDGPDAGVVVVNNKMVDRPIILACQRTLALVKNASSNR